jgi:hypothetical protein
MKSFRFASTLFGAACALSLSGCHGNLPEPPRVTVSAGSTMTVPEKTKLFVVETYSANFGTNGQLFQDRFAALAQSCQVSVEFFRMPSVGDQLTLDPKAELATAQAELTRRLAAFQPDGILEVSTNGWSAPGGLASNPTAAVSYGTFQMSFRLLDGKKRTDQWHGSGSVNVRSGTGGELLAPELVRQLTQMGALPHCPK